MDNWPTNWEIKCLETDQELLERVRSARGLSLADWQRATTLDFAKSFLDPWLLSDMDKAIKRLEKARTCQESVAIYGDYDADGIPGTALLLRGLNHAGYKKILAIIPTRNEGYGLRKERLELLAKQGVTLIVTVDTGITAKEEVDYVTEKGIDVIITDHHEPIKGLPECVAVVDPKIKRNKYPNRSLSGTAVAYKLLWALYEKLGLSHTFLKWQLDLVAIATVADMMELTEENRALVQFGIQVLRKSRNTGLSALMRVSGINAGKVDTGQISFSLAPRLNAPSRLARERHEINGQVSDNVVLTLLTTNDEAQALESAALINQINLNRQNNIQDLVNEALQQKVLPEGGGVYLLEGAPVGLVGLVAGRLSEMSGWPVLVMARINGSVRGSARSATELSIVDLLDQHSQLLDQYGGHKQAGGFTVKAGQEEAFIKQVDKYLAQQKGQYPATKKIVLDTVLQPKEADLAAAEGLAGLAPFGMGNPKPLLALKGKLSGVRRLGQDGRHLRLDFGSDYPSAIWFSANEPFPEAGQEVVAGVTLDVNDYFQPTPQLGINELIIL